MPVRRRKIKLTSNPDDPAVVGDVHLMKERQGAVVTTKCGVIADTSSRSAVRTTAWASEITCMRCVA